MKIKRLEQTRKTMVSGCYDRMTIMTDATLAWQVDEYFKKNRTMPGEKKIKDIAKAQYEAMEEYRNLTADRLPWEDVPWKWNQNVPKAYQTDRDTFMHQMSEIAVKDVELRGDSRPRPLKSNSRPFDTMIAVRNPDVKEENALVHDFYCEVSGKGKEQTYVFENDAKNMWEIDTYGGPIPPGFATNHPHMDGMYAIVSVADYSMGKLGNPNVTFSIDLMQGSDDWSPDQDKKPKWLEHDADDFAEAVRHIPLDSDEGLSR